LFGVGSFSPGKDSFDEFLAVATAMSPFSKTTLTSSLPKPVDVPVMRKTRGAMLGGSGMDLTRVFRFGYGTEQDEKGVTTEYLYTRP